MQDVIGKIKEIQSGQVGVIVYSTKYENIIASYLLLIASFAVISYVRTGYVSVPGIIGFSCFVTYAGFIFISIFKRRSKN
ncbi:hypothetical protein MN033_12500 [Bacillus nitratireducens]|uniref:hypothetical protein n=1 Tax=Bacillus nitratireducens TaxID=2026193 RepID=UPI001F5A2FA6|nr:hypothetical protein [Bacillus nitratireducens]UNP79218.1 hypothetical protein MN033_12500 [Bacillus nitratireducens]